MDDRPEDVDGWLHERVDPLPPPPGTFDLIKRRARRRRLRRAVAGAGTLVAVAAALIVVPRMATSVLHVTTASSSGAAAADGASSRAAQARRASQPASPGQAGQPAGHGTEQPPPAPTATTAPSGPGDATLPPAASVPPNFAATSATFIGMHTGWVIGQAGTPGHCATSYCTSMARTDDGGRTWSGTPAPLAGPPDGSSGVSQVRFLNASDGWAFGPGLFATSDGGRHWAQLGTGGSRVTALETVGDRAFAVFAQCSGTGPSFAAGCTSFSLYSTVAGTSTWAPVPGPVSGLGGGQAGSASLVLTSSHGYLLGPGGTLYSGPVDGSGPWQQQGSLPGGGSCGTGPAQQDGQPSGAMLAAAGPSSLVLACTTQPGAQATQPGAQATQPGAQVYVSSDGGQSWQQAGTAPGGAAVTSLAAQPGGEIVLATTAGIEVSRDGGASWQQAGTGSAAPPGGFGYVGMTTPAQGVAVPADPGQHAVWLTHDGGLTWQRSPIR